MSSYKQSPDGVFSLDQTTRVRLSSSGATRPSVMESCCERERIVYRRSTNEIFGEARLSAYKLLGGPVQPAALRRYPSIRPPQVRLETNAELSSPHQIESPNRLNCHLYLPASGCRNGLLQWI